MATAYGHGKIVWAGPSPAAFHAMPHSAETGLLELFVTATRGDPPFCSKGRGRPPRGDAVLAPPRGLLGDRDAGMYASGGVMGRPAEVGLAGNARAAARFGAGGANEL